MRKKISNFFGEFKKFVTRGNVLDMSVGIIVGGAFTAIVNGLSNYILKPVIDWLLSVILGKDSLSDIYTFLVRGYTVDETTGARTLDLAQSVYIDWGAFINAVINFFLIAFVLFSIVRIINRVKEANERMKEGLETEKAAVQKYRKEGLKKKQAVARYREDLKAEAEKKAEADRLAAEEEAKKAAEEARLAEEKATANTRLLEEIRDLLKNK